MNTEIVNRLAKALLYEGYILYPYRPSVKNRQRWTFGGLHPPQWSEAHGGLDAWSMQTQCLVEGANASIEIIVRFLHLTDRTVAKKDGTGFGLVQSLGVDGKDYVPWQEAEEREVSLGKFNVNDLTGHPHTHAFSFSGDHAIEPLRDASELMVGMLIRDRAAIDGEVEIAADAVGENLHRITVKVMNRTGIHDPANRSRDEAMLHSLISTHTILGASYGEFVSLIDPPEQYKEAVAGCRNIGTWPVLVGESPQRDTMLSSPITLYDYPQLAPESPGDLFDSTEIDEILTLRILTLTDEEKRAAGVDERGANLIARSEALAREQLMNLHGAIRGLRPVPEEQHG